MPQNAPGVISYHVATKQVNHGDPTVEDSMAGIAIKQVEQSWTLGIANRQVIGIGESFAIAHKQQWPVRSALLSSPTKGDPVYITTADNTLSKTAGSGKVPLGRIATVAGDNRGTATGTFVLDLDGRDTL